MAKVNAPADQFYWADLLRDTAMLSPAAVGAWARFLGVTWFGSTRGWFKGDLAAFARMFGTTVDQAEALIREILQYNVGSLGTELADVKDFIDVWDGDAIKDCHGNVTLVNRRRFREWKELEAARIRQSNHRAKARGDTDGVVSRKSNGNVTLYSSSSTSSSTAFKEIDSYVHACVREHADKDPRLVEIAVLETMIRRKGSANEGKAIKSIRYFDQEINQMVKTGRTLGDKAIDALLHRRQEQVSE